MANIRINWSLVCVLVLVVLCYTVAVGVLAKRRLEYDSTYVNKWRPVGPKGWDELEDTTRKPRTKGKRPVDAVPYGADGTLRYGRPPQWLVPLFYANGDKSSDDGLFAGHAIRAGPKGLLAHTRSVARAFKAIPAYTKPKPDSPAICGFDCPDQIFEGDYPTKGNNYFPLLKAPIVNDIAAYFIENHSHDIRQIVIYEFPLDDIPKLAGLNEAWTDQCYLLAYGREPNSSTFFLHQIYLKKVNRLNDCRGNVCTFSTVTAEPRTSGKVCGAYSVLGAPVICEQSNSDRVAWQVVSVGNPKGCATTFQALDLASQFIRIEDAMQLIHNKTVKPPGPVVG